MPDENSELSLGLESSTQRLTEANRDLYFSSCHPLAWLRKYVLSQGVAIELQKLPGIWGERRHRCADAGQMATVIASTRRTIRTILLGKQYEIERREICRSWIECFPLARVCCGGLLQAA